MTNTAILRERHPTPTVEEINMPSLELLFVCFCFLVFSKLDSRSGYHQLSLAPDNRYITTFLTHKGLRSYTRLNYGTNSLANCSSMLLANRYTIFLE